VLDVPMLPKDPRDCVSRLLPIDATSCNLKASDFLSSQKEYRNIVSDLKAAFPKLQVYDPAPNFCDGDECVAKDEKAYYFHDKQHLSVYGSAKVLRDFSMKSGK